jgi:hypothetical protein
MTVLALSPSAEFYQSNQKKENKGTLTTRLLYTTLLRNKTINKYQTGFQYIPVKSKYWCWLYSYCNNNEALVIPYNMLFCCLAFDHNAYKLYTHMVAPVRVVILEDKNIIIRNRSYRTGRLESKVLVNFKKP